MIEMKHISDFLTTVEGPRQTVGYIPCNLKSGGTANYKGGKNPENYQAMGASGVTIATGCDLGQTDAASLRGYGLSQSIINIYADYFGKKKDAAIQFLHDHPLGITAAQAEQTDWAVHSGYLKRYVIPAFEKKSLERFENIPANAQDVVMSVCFQKGVGGVAREWPKLWNFLTACNWKRAAQELRTGFTQYQGRRLKEARHLELML